MSCQPDQSQPQIHTYQRLVAAPGDPGRVGTEFTRTSNGIGIVIPEGWLLEGENHIHYSWTGTRRLEIAQAHGPNVAVNNWPCSLEGTLTITTEARRRSDVRAPIADYVPQHDGDNILEANEDPKWVTAPNAWAPNPDTAPHIDPNRTARGCRIVVTPSRLNVTTVNGFGATQCYDSAGVDAYESNTGVDVDALPACPTDSSEVTEQCVATN